ncbi:hypothetical protein KZ483_13230 [Paenibacillus sp. sptzw28]|uniref:hypothetical protein n=1 Tax=Paenibacillus sp. sptzw28 TaxID=715179 RepID=UPI001C6DD51E|nr:hypothetical protein [Paenibacillus sp. sptzw28]QYR23763.1 hypothetical protein KZ483_13230 [Paenibacillus sp. sptzw28]
MTPKQIMVEYRTEAASLTLAPGWKWPDSPVSSHAPDGRDFMYQKGWGKQAADLYWFCSWASRAVNPQLPEAGRQQALEHVLSIRTKYFYTTALAADSKPGFDQMLRNAADGKMDDLRGYYESNFPKAGS